MEKEEEVRVYTHLTEQLKYLYELEVERASKLDSAARNYFVFLTSTTAATITVAGWFLKDASASTEVLRSLPTMGVVLVCVAGCALCINFGFVLMTWQIRHFARLGDPTRLARSVATAVSEVDALQYIAADFVAAANIDYQVNQRKARWLYYCFPVYLFALMSLFSGAVVLILGQH